MCVADIGEEVPHTTMAVQPQLATMHAALHPVTHSCYADICGYIYTLLLDIPLLDILFLDISLLDICGYMQTRLYA